MRLPARPTIYEINTAVWLGGRTLAEVPAADWDALAALPVDAVWLMGVWRRSPAGLAIALDDPGLTAGFRAALPDVHQDDIIGSPYCVREYVVDERFGGRDALAAARAELAERGVGLVLDYVPNHVAPDHPWVAAHPEYLVAGSEDDLARDPAAFLRTPGGIVARGRDPYFPPWPDVVQLNAFSSALRDAVVELLTGVGEQCDALRCDMAMLMTNEVFARTWHAASPDEDFWPYVIGRVKAARPDLVFIAEAYWDMEWTLQQQGFDYCYDKRLYDRLVHEGADAVRGHLSGDAAYQERLLRFIENHDEPRAAATFAPGPARAAAVVAATVPGARLFHDGQLDGYRVHIPVFLARGPAEIPDEHLRAFYDRLLHAVAESDLRTGDWRLCECTGWPDNDSRRRLVAWCWEHHLVVVNLGDAPAQANLHLPWENLAGRDWALTDHLSGERFERSGNALAGEGLYVALDGWGLHFLAFTPRLAATTG
jgi:hypothetical protein